MSTLRSRWDGFWHAPSSGERVAWVRVLLGLYTLAYFGAQWQDAALLYSNEGVYSPYLVPDYAPSPPIAQALLALLLFAAAALTVGYQAELAAATLFTLFLHHYFLSLGAKQSAFDRLLAIDLLVLCVADSGRVFGLDARRKGPVPTVWGERVLAAQTCFLYLGPGIWKLCTPAWHTGELLHSNLQGMFATRIAFALSRLELPAHGWALASWAVIVFELAMPPLLLSRHTRSLALWLGAAFHVFNCVVLVIPEFLLSLVAYPVFVDETTLRGARLRATACLPRVMRARTGG